MACVDPGVKLKKKVLSVLGAYLVWERNGGAAQPTQCMSWSCALLHPAEVTQVLSSPERQAGGPAFPEMGADPIQLPAVALSGCCGPASSACWEGVAGLWASLPVGPCLALLIPIYSLHPSTCNMEFLCV